MLLTSLLLTATLFTTVTTLSCRCPKVSSCSTPKNCKGGLAPDICFCCKVCAKIEGESCGGSWNRKGTCDVGLKCVFSDEGNMRAFGRCQRDKSLCEKKQCGFRQQCSMTKHGKAVCICPRNCRESKQSPVCGIKNGNQYKNPCELHRHECRSGKEVGLLKGPCKRCYHLGRDYRFKEARRGHAPCEKCVCYHGDWVCKAKKHCQDTLDFCTVFKDPTTGLVTSTCPEEFWCKVQIPSIPEQNIPGVGKCVPSEETATNSSTNNASSSAKTRAVINICELPLKPGSCRPSLSRWYFNKTRRKCVKFNSGGCNGNANNFRTKSSCRNTCMRRKGQSSKSPNSTKPTKSSSTRRHTKPTTEQVKTMTVICQLPPAPGPCRAAMPQWYYNPKKQRCSRFIYGGCGGNDNNFDSKDECKAACMRNKGSKLTRTTESVARLSSESTPTSSSTSRKTTRPTTIARTLKTKTTPTQRTSTTPTPTTTTPSVPTTTTKPTLRSKKPFKCPCSDCKLHNRVDDSARELTGKGTCWTHYGCFTSQIFHADGSQMVSYGCVEDRQHYTLMCNVRTPDERQPKMILECCKGHMCNRNDIFVNDPPQRASRGRTDIFKKLAKGRRSPTTTQTATLMKESSSPEKPRCYDGHSKKFYGETEEWKPNDCTVCTCRSGQPACVATVCRHPRCLDPIRIQGQCCPVCNQHGNLTEDSQEMIKALAESQLTTVLVSIKKNKDQRFCEDLNTGELYLSGQNWKVDDCTTCYCQRDGKIACAVQMCSGYPGCLSPVKEKGQCCPVCKDDDEEELIYPENEVVDSPDSCLDPVTGDYYKRSAMWQQDDCTACICGADRKYQCRKTTCKPLTCEKTIKLKGRCCPACSTDTKSGCSFEGQKYLEGEYKLLADHCTLCECSSSEWICSSRRCHQDDKPAL